MKQPVKHDVKRSTVFAGTTAIQPEDAGDTRRFFEYTRSMPDTFVPPVDISDPAATAAFDRITADVDRRIREIAGRQPDMPTMPDFSALKPLIESVAADMSRAVATFCNAVKHDMKHGPWLLGVDPGLGPDRSAFVVREGGAWVLHRPNARDPEPNGIRVTHERNTCPWWRASGRPRWSTAYRAECRIRTRRGRRRR